MSKFQNIVTELKKFLADIPQEQAFNVTADDLVIAEMKVGGKVEAKDAEGNIIPAPDGEYTIGEDVIVVKEGMIASLNGKTEEAPAEQMADENASVDNSDLQSQVDALQKEVDDLKAAIADMKTTMSAESKKDETFSNQLSELNNTLKVLMNTPAEFSKTNDKAIVIDAKEEKKNAWSSVLANAFKNK